MYILSVCLRDDSSVPQPGNTDWKDNKFSLLFLFPTSLFTGGLLWIFFSSCVLRWVESWRLWLVSAVTLSREQCVWYNVSVPSLKWFPFSRCVDPDSSKHRFFWFQIRLFLPQNVQYSLLLVWISCARVWETLWKGVWRRIYGPLGMVPFQMSGWKWNVRELVPQQMVTQLVSGSTRILIQVCLSLISFHFTES